MVKGPELKVLLVLVKRVEWCKRHHLQIMHGPDDRYPRY